MPDMVDAAKVAYVAYVATIRKIAFRGEVMHEWDRLSRETRSAWVAAIGAVFDYWLHPGQK